jgi:integrase
VGANVAASLKAPRKAHPSTTAPRTEQRPKVIWEPEELERFRVLADQDQWAAAWRLARCGLRRSEVMGMAWGAVDLERGEVTVSAGRVLLDGHRTAIDDPKSTASRRTVPAEQIRPGTVAMLRALKARQAADRLMIGPGYPDTGLVLVDAIGTPIRPEAYSDRFRALSREAGIPRAVLHSARHTRWP